MSKIQRVKKLCKWLIFNDFAENDTDLAGKLGYTKSSFSQIMNEKVPLSEKFINKLCECDDNINKVWINDGLGDMLVNSNQNAKFVATNIIDAKMFVDLCEKVDFIYTTTLKELAQNQLAGLKSDIENIKNEEAKKK